MNFRLLRTCVVAAAAFTAAFTQVGADTRLPWEDAVEGPSARLDGGLVGGTQDSGVAAATNTATTCQPMSAMNLVGLWTGSRGIVGSEAREFRNWADGSFAYWPRVQDPNARIFAFDFRADGSYSFGYGAKGAVWTSHRGCYSVGRASDAAATRYPYLLTLTPAASTVKPGSPAPSGQMPAGFADLARGPRTFRLKESSVGGLLIIDDRIDGRDLLNDIGAVRIYSVN